MENTSETPRERLQRTLAWMQGIQRQLLFSKELDASITVLYTEGNDPEVSGRLCLGQDDCWSVNLNIYYGNNQVRSFWVDGATSPEEVITIKERAIAFLKEHGINIAFVKDTGIIID